MVNINPGVPFAALLVAAALGAQSRSPSEELQQPPPPLALDASSTAGGAAPRAQEPDYSLYGLFMQEHGDFMRKHERYDPMLEFSLAYMPNLSIQGEAGRFDNTFASVDLEYDLMVSPDWYAILGAYGSTRHYEVKNMSAFSDENLNSAGIRFGFGGFVDHDILFEVVGEPGIWSDMDNGLHHRDYDFPARALVTWRTTDDFFFKFGARYNQVYRDAPWLPYVGFSWTVNEQLRVDILAPESIEVSWWPDPSFGFLFGTQIQGAQYRVRTSSATGAVQADAQVQEIIAYGGILSRFSDNMSFEGRIGATVAGDYKLTNGDVATFGRADGTLEPGFFVQATLGFSF